MGTALLRPVLVGVTAVAAALAALAPGSLAQAAGSHVLTVTGRVSVTVAYPAHAGGRRVGLLTRNTSYTLVGAGTQDLASGSVVAATGTLSGRTLSVTSTQVVARPRAVSTTGTQTVADILVDWTSPDSVTPDSLKAAIGSAGDWFNVVSAGRLPSLSVTNASDWLSIAAPNGCDQDTIYREAVAAAGINESSYDHVVVYFPNFQPTCSWAGLGEEPGRQVWLNGLTDTGVLTHELGHNLGLWHAHALACNAPGGGPNTAAMSDNCLFPPVEYGDPADTMGNEAGNGAPWYDAPHLAQLGWLGSDLAVETPCAGAVHVAPYETPGAVRALEIDAGAESHPQRPGVLTEPVSYWVEARQPTGLDSSLPAGLTNGVLVHMTDPSWTTASQADYGTDLLDGTPDGSSNFGDAAVPAGSSITTPQGMTLTVNSSDGSGATVTLSSSVPSRPTSVSAAPAGNAVRVSWQPPACTGGAPISSYVVTALNDDGSLAATTTTTGTSVSLPIAPTTDRQIFVAAKNTAGATGADALAPTSAPTITRVFAYTSPSEDQFQVTIAPSVANGGAHLEGYQVHAVGPDGDRGSFIPLGQDHTGTYPVVHGATYTVWVAPIVRSDGTEGTPSPSMSLVAGDDQAPTAGMSGGAQNWRLAASVPLSWHGSDIGGSGLASFDVRTRTATATSGLGAWTYPAGWQGTNATAATVPIAAGATACFAVRARDHNTNTSAWSAASCWSRPLDDRALAASAGWTRGTGSTYYAHTISTTNRVGSRLSRAHVHATALLLVVTRCKTCGSVAVYEGQRLVKTIALTASTTRNRVQITIALPTKATGATISLRATTTKPVRIDALGLRAY